MVFCAAVVNRASNGRDGECLCPSFVVSSNGRGRGSDTLLWVQPVLGPAGGRGGLAEWVIFHFSPSSFHSKHELETKATFRWD